ncbi:MAG: hypothetical protein ABJH68_11815 [Ilumatobacter sp.]|uniref:hypothetical protein n=1 Tax=Ilumatobacter sp. TaxID=1967498 RepID=UPI00329748DE
MIRTERSRFALAIAAVAILSTGCGRLVERASEEAVEQAIENDSGEEVDIDFDDGGVRVESADGDITFNADENGVQIDGADADGNDISINADENGFEAEGPDGEVVTGAADGDGGFTVEGPEGEAVFSTTQGIPDEWPDDVPRPEGLSDATGTYLSEGDVVNLAVTGTVSGDPTSTFDGYVDELLDAGFEEESTFTQGESTTASFVRGEQQLIVSIQSDGSASLMTVSLI